MNCTFTKKCVIIYQPKECKICSEKALNLGNSQSVVWFEYYLCCGLEGITKSMTFCCWLLFREHMLQVRVQGHEYRVIKKRPTWTSWWAAFLSSRILLVTNTKPCKVIYISFREVYLRKDDTGVTIDCRTIF